MGYIDLHCDTISRIMQTEGASLKDNDFMINIPGMKRAGTDVQFFACFLYALRFEEHLKENEKNWENIHEDTWDRAYEYAIKMLDCLDNEMSEDIRLALTYEDLLRNKEDGVISAVKTVEEGGIINGDLGRIKGLYNRGVRLITLTWNFKNCLGHPSSKIHEYMEKGLTPLGIDAVEQMNELGIIIDVSHLSDGGFYDCINYSKKPICASHSDVRAICNHPRNLSDRMLRTLGEHGGVAGLNFCPEFLREDEKVSIEDEVKHILYMINKGGEDVVAFGSDFDGITNPYRDNWTNTVNDMPLLIEALKKSGLTERQMDKLMYGNAMRLIKDNWK